MPIVQGGYFSPDNNIVSPGVFTREIDQSQVAQGVAQIGGVVVAPFKQGPGFTPTVCNSVAQLQNQFGIPDGTLYGPYTATQYLQEKGFVTVCRVGALTGYWLSVKWFLVSVQSYRYDSRTGFNIGCIDYGTSYRIW